MAQFTTAEREGILAEARAHVAGTKRAPDGHVQRRAAAPDIVYKTHMNDAPAVAERAAATEPCQPWQEWVDARLDAVIEGIGQSVGEMHNTALRKIAMLERELTTLRNEVAVERGLRDLRSEIDQARSEVPQVPAITAKLERKNVRLRRELAATKEKIDRMRAGQSMTDFRLNELRKATEKRAAAVEVSIANFVMQPIHPDAGAALRDYATDMLEGNRTLYAIAP
jgi:hypothetical protein